MHYFDFSRRSGLGFALICLLLALGVSNQVTAEIRQVDGNIWLASSTDEKRAYLMGVANVVAVNRALQVKHDELDPDAANNKISTAMDAGTIDGAISKIDGWYGVDSARLDTPVLGVVWLALVGQQ